jgi:hypothetical protein
MVPYPSVGRNAEAPERERTRLAHSSEMLMVGVPTLAGIAGQGVIYHNPFPGNVRGSVRPARRFNECIPLLASSHNPHDLRSPLRRADSFLPELPACHQDR